MIVLDIIKAAARKVNILASGEDLEDDERDDLIQNLQTMLRSWSAEKINVFSSVHEDHTLTGGVYTYTWGIGGVINTIRPNQVTGVSILDSANTTYPVEIISEARYRRIVLKTTVARPNHLFPLYGFPYITIHLHPIPKNSEILKLESLKPFTETSSFATEDDTLQMPVNYEEAIIYNLAIRAAPEYGKSISREVAKIASDSYNRLITRNSSNQVEPVRLSLPVQSYRNLSIRST